VKIIETTSNIQQLLNKVSGRWYFHRLLPTKGSRSASGDVLKYSTIVPLLIHGEMRHTRALEACGHRCKP
jgi:hypothetical protein